MGFEIDQKAFRSQNVGRKPQHLIREAIQNGFDENPDHIRIDVRAAKGRGIEIDITDDGPGFSNVKDIWTIFASGKRDDPTKRGRLGRGLKELISVSSTAVIKTAGCKVTFEWTGKTFKRKSSKWESTGTSIEITVPSWKRTAIPEIKKYLSLFIPPAGTAMIVNGIANVSPLKECVISNTLETVIYSEAGVPEIKWRTTEIHVLKTIPGQSKWFFEMGIPVEEIPEADGFEWHVDIQQRTPLRPERDMLPRTFIRNVYGCIANEMLATLPTEELTDLWMEEAIQSWKFDSALHGKLYVKRRFGERAARAVNADPHDRNLLATQDGLNVIQTQQLSAPVRELVKANLPTTVELYPIEVAAAVYIPEEDWTTQERRFIKLAKWLAGYLNLPGPTIIVVECPESNVIADSTKSATEIRINRSILGGIFFEHPKLSNWITLIIHELAHRTGNGHDQVFWAEYERLTGEAVEIIHHLGSELDEIMTEEITATVSHEPVTTQ